MMMAFKITPRVQSAAVRQLHSLARNICTKERWRVPLTSCHNYMQLQHEQINTSSVCTRKQILSLSSTIYQDGQKIKEFPTIMTRKENLALTDEDSTRKIKEISVEDEHLKREFEGCETIWDVFRILELPSEKVTGYSAAFSIKKIMRLQGFCDESADPASKSFVSKTIMNGLYNKVVEDIKHLSNKMVISLLELCFNSKEVNAGAGDAIREEIDNRIGLGAFEIKELCLLNDVVKIHGEGELMKYIWVHIGNRYQDLSETDITKVIANLPKEYGYILTLMIKPLISCMWKLDKEDVQAIMHAFSKKNFLCNTFNQELVNWITVHYHLVSESLLTDVMKRLIECNYHDLRMLYILKKYLNAVGHYTSFGFLANVLDYCRHFRFFSFFILKLGAESFIKKVSVGHCMDQNDLLKFLRVYGYFHFVQLNQEFFHVAGNVLEKHVNSIDKHVLAELLCSFTYLDKIPSRFLLEHLSQHFTVDVIREMKNDETKKKLLKNLGQIAASILYSPLYDIETLKVDQDFTILYLYLHEYEESLKRDKFPETGTLRYEPLVQSIIAGNYYSKVVQDMLHDFVGPDNYYSQVHHLGNLIDFFIAIDENNEIISSNTTEWETFLSCFQTETECRGLAILLATQEDFSKWAGFSGEFSAKVKQLSCEGFDVIVLPEQKHRRGKDQTSLRNHFLNELIRHDVRIKYE